MKKKKELKRKVLKKEMYKLVKHWYDVYMEEQVALHDISKSVPFKTYIHSRGLKHMFHELMTPTKKKKSVSDIKKVSDRMADLFNDYTDTYLKNNPGLTLEDMEKVEPADYMS